MLGKQLKIILKIVTANVNFSYCNCGNYDYLLKETQLKVGLQTQLFNYQSMLNSSRCVLNSSYILNRYWPPTSRITTIRTYTETFVSVPKETSPILVTPVVGNNKQFIRKKNLLAYPEKKTRRKKRKNRMAIAKLFGFHASATN